MSTKWLKWSPKEVQILQSLAGELPTSLIQKRLSKYGHERSIRAIQCKAYDLGLSLVVSHSSLLHLVDVANLLKRDPSAIRSLAKNNPKVAKILALRKIDRKIFIARKNLVKLAYERPSFFAGAPQENLLYLLEDPALVETIVGLFPSKVMDFRVRSSDGEIWESVNQIGRVFNVPAERIFRSIKIGHPVVVSNGFKKCALTFERIGTPRSKIGKTLQELQGESSDHN
jgi:hypothetical protein